MIDLSQDDLELVRRILLDHVPGVEVRAYGSRVRGNAERFSDLAIRVDVVNWNAISPEFRAAIAAKSEVLVARAERDRTP